VVHQDLQRIKQRQLAAAGKDGLVHAVVRPEVGSMTLHNRLAQLRNPRNHRIAGKVGVNSGNRRILDVPRSRKMRLTGPKIHQVSALSA
jgi:hypothetical protein